MRLRSDDNKRILCQQFESERSLILKIRLSNVPKIKIIISMINTNQQLIKKIYRLQSKQPVHSCYRNGNCTAQNQTSTNKIELEF